MSAPAPSGRGLDGWEFAAVQLHSSNVTSHPDGLGRRGYRAECLSCPWVGKIRWKSGSAEQDRFIHSHAQGTYDFGFSGTNPLLERALRALARSGFTFQQVCTALEQPWPHYIDERPERPFTAELCVFDARGIGAKSVAALIEAREQGVLAHLGEPEAANDLASVPAPVAQANDIATT